MKDICCPYCKEVTGEVELALAHDCVRYEFKCGMCDKQFTVVVSRTVKVEVFKIPLELGNETVIDRRLPTGLEGLPPNCS